MSEQDRWLEAELRRGGQHARAHAAPEHALAAQALPAQAHSEGVSNFVAPARAQPFELSLLAAQAPARAEECPLGRCDGSGFIADESTNTASDCGCRAARIASAQTRSLAARIPARYRGVSFERAPVTELARSAPDQVESVRRYIARIEENLGLGKGLWIQGDVGTGKTTLAMLVSKAALQAGRSVAIYSLPRLLNLLREAMDSAGGKLDLLDRLTAVDLLHLDDLGAENRTDWVLEQLYSIVNGRYEAQRAIVATTNLMPDELSQRLGARTVSRLVEICGDLIPLFGEDRRREFRPG